MTESIPSHPLMPRTLKLISALLCFKLLFFLIIYFNVILIPSIFNWKAVLANFHWPDEQSYSWINMFKTWDANQYIYLSEIGYKAGQMPNAMYPLWPFMIRLGRYLFQDSLVSAMVLSNLFSLLAFLAYYRFVFQQHGRAIAETSLILALVFPGALFYCFAYSESIFFLLTILCFMAINNRKYMVAASLGFFCPLAKAIGVFITLPIGYAIWKDWREKKVPSYYFLMVIIPFLGYAAVFLIMYLSTGNAFEAFEAQSKYIAQASISKIFNPLELLKNLFAIQPGHNFFSSPFDRLWFILAMIGLYSLFRMDKKMFFYSFPLVVIPAISTSFMSYTRYVAPIFPLFTVYGALFVKPRWRMLYWNVIAFMAILQIFFLIRHINYYWVA